MSGGRRDFQRQLTDRVREAGRVTRAARERARREGKDPDDAELRAALEYSIQGLHADLPDLEAALGQQLDPGSFFIAVSVMTYLQQGVDLGKAIAGSEYLKAVFSEMIEKARIRPDDADA